MYKSALVTAAIFIALLSGIIFMGEREKALKEDVQKAQYKCYLQQPSVPKHVCDAQAYMYMNGQQSLETQ